MTTFFTMAYIISVNAVIMKDSGGTCVCTSTTDKTCRNDAAYNACLLGLSLSLSKLHSQIADMSMAEIQRELITATAAIAGFGTTLFGIFTNMPVALA